MQLMPFFLRTSVDWWVLAVAALVAVGLWCTRGALRSGSDGWMF